MASNGVAALVKPPLMSGVIYFRDPRNPGDVFGPVPLDQVRQCVEQGRVRAGDQVSFDKHSWMPASELEPVSFPARRPIGSRVSHNGN
ncbi:MAG TPA: hypothetical protein VHX68_03755, partial [Planctomycetaceae bacterium]|nr:hypothetical protein [Planctomycetaceae bacterium]